MARRRTEEVWGAVVAFVLNDRCVKLSAKRVGVERPVGGADNLKALRRR